MASYEGGWRNRLRYLYCQYMMLDECQDKKLLILLERHGMAFDDNWTYRKRGRTRNIVTRFPLWMNTERDYSEDGDIRK